MFNDFIDTNSSNTFICIFIKYRPWFVYAFIKKFLLEHQKQNQQEDLHLVKITLFAPIQTKSPIIIFLIIPPNCLDPGTVAVLKEQLI